MAAGDLLYIVAFIILPTAVLVSCIWALVLLRNGTLLPARPRVHDERAEDWREPAEYGPVEETGEHQIIEPVAATPEPAAPIAPAPTAPTIAEPQPVATPDNPPVQSTEEFQIVTPEQIAAPSADLPETPTTRPDTRQNGSVSIDPAPSQVSVDDDASLMIVPLEDHGATSPSTAAHAEHIVQSQVGTSNGKSHGVATSTQGPRRPTRHLTPPRTTDSPGSNSRPRTSQRRASRRPDGDR